MQFKLPMKIGACSGITFVMILLIGWIVFPKLIRSQIKNMKNLKPGGEVREMYMKAPFPLDFKVYVFNVTNPEDVGEKGARPIVQEIGPYWFDEWKEKVDAKDNEEDDTLEYNFRNTFYFNKAKTLPLTGNEPLSVIHPFIGAISLAVEIEKPGAMALLNKALNSIFSKPTTPFLSTTAASLLYKGVEIPCNVTDFAGKAVCTQISAEAEGVEEIAPGILRFSIIGAQNGTLSKRMKVKRGVENIMDIGKVITYDEKPQLSIWGSEECNQFVGTDTTIFAPFIPDKEPLKSFGSEICRNLPAYFVENTKYEGIPVRKYSADFGDQSMVPEEKCYCPREDFCYKKGIHDMMKCIHAPMMASLPHFYLAHESYVKGVKGLNPNKDDHEIIILFEALTGTPLFAKKRLQFSLPVHPLDKIDAMKNMPDCALPMMWMEEGVALNATWTGPLKNQLFRMLNMVKVVKWLLLVLSLAGMAGAAYLHFNKKTIQITAVTKANNKSSHKDGVQTLGRNDNGHINHAMSSNDIDKY